jgi:hypothetical protein
MLAQQTIPASRDARGGPPMEFVLSEVLAPSKPPALDDVVRADVDCRPDNAATAVIAEHLFIPVELSPAGIVVTARPFAPPWFFLGVEHG